MYSFLTAYSDRTSHGPVWWDKISFHNITRKFSHCNLNWTCTCTHILALLFPAPFPFKLCLNKPYKLHALDRHSQKQLSETQVIHITSSLIYKLSVNNITFYWLCNSDDLTKIMYGLLRKHD